MDETESRTAKASGLSNWLGRVNRARKKNGWRWFLALTLLPVGLLWTVLAMLIEWNLHSVANPLDNWKRDTDRKLKALVDRALRPNARVTGGSAAKNGDANER